jgi:hypothetical protein
MMVNNAVFRVNQGTNAIVNDGGLDYIIYASTFMILQSTQVTTSAFPVSITGFQFQIPANSTWTYDCHMSVLGMSGGMAFGINGPAGSVPFMSIIGGGASGTAVLQPVLVTQLNTASAAVATAATARHEDLYGTIYSMSTAGAVYFQFGRITASNNATLTPGSFCRVQRAM